MIVGDMLVIASPASAEVGTDRLDAVDRPQDNFLELRPVKAAPVLDQFSFDPFPVYSTRHKSDFSINPTDAGAAECDVMDVHFNKRAGCEIRSRTLHRRSYRKAIGRN